MKSLFKNVNTFGLMGVLLAGGLVFTQSAFKAAKSDKAVELRYGYDYTNHAWIPKNTAGYTCNQEVDKVCDFIFSTPPTSQNNPSNSTPAPNAELGTYEN